MPANHDEILISEAFASVREIEPGDDLVAAVVAQRTPHRKAPLRFRPATARFRFALQGLATLALLGSVLYVVPTTRAAIEDAGGDVSSVFTGWVGGNSTEAPGKPLAPGETAPKYFYEEDFVEEPRVIAEAGEYKLFAYLEPSTGHLGFDLGNTGYGSTFDPAEFDDSALYVLGPGAMQHADPQGHVPLFGVVARSVRSIELTYVSGPPLKVDDVDGGFVLLAEPSREPIEVIALNARGEEVGHQLVDNSPHSGARIEWSEYEPSANHEP